MTTPDFTHAMNGNDAFGDDDPEDAWDAGDPTPAKLALLVRVINSIFDEYVEEGDTVRHRARLVDLARLVEDTADG